MKQLAFNDNRTRYAKGDDDEGPEIDITPWVAVAGLLVFWILANSC